MAFNQNTVTVKSLMKDLAAMPEDAFVYIKQDTPCSMADSGEHKHIGDVELIEKPLAIYVALNVETYT